jgi:transposase
MSTDSSTTPLYIAIDIGKNVHCYAAYVGWQLREVQAPQEILSNRGGYEAFRRWLQEQVAEQPERRILIGFEPTGVYHEAWVNGLQRDFGERIELRQINPYQVTQKRAQQKNGRKRKSDPIDTRAITYCLRDGLGCTPQAPQADSLRFELWARSIRQTQRMLGRLARQVLAQVDRLWPGLLLDVPAFQRAHPLLSAPEPWVRTRPLERKLLALLLEHAPNPYTWQGWSPDQIQRFYRSHGLGCGPKTLVHIRRVLANLLLPAPDLAALMAEQLHNDFLLYQQLAQRLAALSQQAEQLVPGSPAAVLTTFGGIGAFLAAQYVAWVGDPRRFQHADQIWSLAGFDPAQDDSGDRRRVGKITKRGAGALRHILYTIGLTASQNCPQLAATKQRALQRGLGPVGAVIHVAHRANRICFRLLRDQLPFDPLRLR